MIFKRYIFFIAVISTFVGCIAQKEQPQERLHLVVQHGVVSQRILRLLELADVHANDSSLASVVTATQAVWLRKPGQEYWHMKTLGDDVRAEAIRKECDQLHMLHEIKPARLQYEHALLLGATFETMVERMEYLIQCWNDGVRFNDIVLLAGARPASAEVREVEQAFKEYAGIDHLPHAIETETDMLLWIYQHCKMPEAMRQVPVVLVDIPMQMTKNQTLRRPNTADTIHGWLEKSPAIGPVLAISNQPFVLYQESVLKTVLPSAFDLDVIGNKAEENVEAGYLLDTLARILYQEKQRLAL